MKNRVQRLYPTLKGWPSPVARYYLGMISFPDLLESATGQRELPGAIEVARSKLLSRRELCQALFHDGVRSRAQGDEGLCLTRMRECYALEDPLIEEEWYLARYEVQKAELLNS